KPEEKPKHFEQPVLVAEPHKPVEKPVAFEEKHAHHVTGEKTSPTIAEEQKQAALLPVEKQALPVEKKPAFELKEEKRELKPQLGLFSKIKSVFTNKITITEAETGRVFDDLQMALLEADVSFDTANFLVADLRARLIGREVEKNAVENAINSEVAASLSVMLTKNKIDFLEEVKKREKPVKILFLGPNGAGKTTTIAKLVAFLKQNGFSSVISASDVFRAAAIEQASFHGEKLGVKVIKHAYGADPTAVAFDAIAHAKAQKIDCVLIDTAGRQETNFNLLKEMDKMNRVIKPDLKIFIGEAIAGNALVEQVKKFNETVGLDAIILTKLDCDAKGGTSLSLAYETQVPIAFIGVGQEYADLRPFDAQWLVKNIVG
ncbi:MAG: signal recognition particle-docking protein FtsY, partial [Candidatus Micrarchaeota archaeon]